MDETPYDKVPSRLQAATMKTEYRITQANQTVHEERTKKQLFCDCPIRATGQTQRHGNRALLPGQGVLVTLGKGDGATQKEAFE